MLLFLVLAVFSFIISVYYGIVQYQYLVFCHSEPGVLPLSPEEERAGNVVQQPGHLLQLFSLLPVQLYIIN